MKFSLNISYLSLISLNKFGSIRYANYIMRPTCLGRLNESSYFKGIFTNKNFSNNFQIRFISSTPFLMQKKSKKKKVAVEADEVDNNEVIDNDKNFNKMLMEAGGNLFGVSSVAVIQPWIKWGRNKRIDTNALLLLDEACALIKSLPFVDVSYKNSVSVENMCKTRIFGSGSLEKLVHEVNETSAQAVFISIDHLSRVQKCALEAEFSMRVFDRYFIVLAIFKHHASSLESKIQIAMAELPFMSKRYLSDKERLILDQRESNLKAAVKKLSGRRERVRRAREKSSLSSIAIVGYTNCGKTTLIRALTGDLKVEGEDRLFATLDVTAHKGALPCDLNVVFLDSVGFIQDIPTSLIASFEATLQDTIHADVVVLVRDVSHPDVRGQTKAVRATLRALPLSDETPVVVVNNKADLLSPSQRDQIVASGEQGALASAVTGEGLNAVLYQIQEQLLRVTGRKNYLMKLPAGSPKIEWLKTHLGVPSEEVDPDDPQVTRVHVVMNEAEKAAFRRAFT